jgi:hypothetical protein
LTEEELRLREARKSLGKLTSLVSSVINNASLRVTVDPKFIALSNLNESLQGIANVNDDLMDNAEFNAAAVRFNENTQESLASVMPSVNSGASTEEDRTRYSAFLKEQKASLSSSSAIVTRDSALLNGQKASESVVDMTSNDEEDDDGDASSPEWHDPNSDQYEEALRFEELLKELEQRSKLGLLDTLEDTRVAFNTLLGEGVLDGEAELYIPHSYTIQLAHMFFQRIDPFNVCNDQELRRETKRNAREASGTL